MHYCLHLMLIAEHLVLLSLRLAATRQFFSTLFLVVWRGCFLVRDVVVYNVNFPRTWGLVFLALLNEPRTISWAMGQILSPKHSHESGSIVADDCAGTVAASAFSVLRPPYYLHPRKFQDVSSWNVKHWSGAWNVEDEKLLYVLLEGASRTRFNQGNEAQRRGLKRLFGKSRRISSTDIPSMHV